MKRRVFTVVNLAVAAVFAFAAAAQWNDPDPAQWIAFYGAAAAACLIYDRVARGWLGAAGVLAVAVLWGATFAGDVIGHVELAELVDGELANEGRVELGRELGGLAIVSVWMIVLLAVAGWRAAHSPASQSISTPEPDTGS